MTHLSADELSRLADGGALTGEEGAPSGHLLQCASCREALSALLSAEVAVREELVEAPPGYFETLPDRVLARIAAADLARRVDSVETGPETGRRRQGASPQVLRGRWPPVRYALAAAATLFVAIVGPWLVLRAPNEAGGPELARNEVGDSSATPAVAPAPIGAGQGASAREGRPAAVPEELGAAPPEQKSRGGGSASALGVAAAPAPARPGAPPAEQESRSEGAASPLGGVAASAAPDERSRLAVQEEAARAESSAWNVKDDLAAGRAKAEVRPAASAALGEQAVSASSALAGDAAPSLASRSGEETLVRPAPVTGAAQATEKRKGASDASQGRAAAPAAASLAELRERARRLEGAQNSAPDEARAEALRLAAMEAWLEAWRLGGVASDREAAVSLARVGLRGAHQARAREVLRELGVDE